MNFPTIPRIPRKKITIPWIFRCVCLLFSMSREKCAMWEAASGGNGSPDIPWRRRKIPAIRWAAAWSACTLRKNSQIPVDVAIATFKNVFVARNGYSMSQDPTPREMGYYFALVQVGVEMVLPTLLGYWIDSWLETTPWLTIIAAVVGFAGGMIHLIVILRQKERDESSGKR